MIEVTRDLLAGGDLITLASQHISSYSTECCDW
jgi:hypothetical protein